MTTMERETVGTIWGTFDQARADSLRETLKAAKEANVSETKFEDADLDVRFGEYLLEFVDNRLKDHR